MKLFQKLKDEWKKEWLEKNIAEITSSYQSELESTKTYLEDKINSQKVKNQILLNNLKIEEEEIAYKLKILNDRKLEVIQKDNELKDQIKILEAKASPSSVWCEAFTQGMNKAWDLMFPVMSENIEKVKQAIYDKATTDTLARLNGNNKKIN